MDKRLVVIALATALLTGCVTVPTGPRVAVLPAPGKDLVRFQGDQAMCQQFAQNSVGTSAQDAAAQSAAASALLGALVGAAAGALMGSPGGYAGQGAAWGAGTGLLFGGTAGMGTASVAQQDVQQRFDMAYMQCMYAQGNQIPGQPAPQVNPVQGQAARGFPAPRNAGIPPPDTPPPNLAPPSGSGLAPGSVAYGNRTPAPRASAPGTVAGAPGGSPSGGYAPTASAGQAVPASSYAANAGDGLAANATGPAAPPPGATPLTPGFGVPAGPVQKGAPLTVKPPTGGSYPPLAYPPPDTPPPAGAS